MVSLFYLEFSWNENYDKIKHSQRISSELSGSHGVSLDFLDPNLEKSNETL